MAFDWFWGYEIGNAQLLRQPRTLSGPAASPSSTFTPKTSGPTTVSAPSAPPVRSTSWPVSLRGRMKGRHKSDSSEQGRAQSDMLDAVNRKRRLTLRPEALKLKHGIRVELDGYDPDTRSLCEVYAHIGPLKGSQPDKIASDILKMLLVENDLGGRWHKIYCFADEAAAEKLKGDSWLACVARQFAVEPETVDLPEDTRHSVLNSRQ